MSVGSRSEKQGRRFERAAFFAMPLNDLMARGTVSAADGQKKMRVLQCKFLAGETRDGLEHFEPYGYTSEPLKDGQPEALALFFDGDRSHGVVVCVADRRYRLKIEPGEVAIYDDVGQKVHLKRDGIEVVTPGWLHANVGADAVTSITGSETSTVGGDLTTTVTGNAVVKAAKATVDAADTMITGNLLVQGKITGMGGLAVSGGGGASVEGSLSTTGDVTAGGISLQTHTHPGDSGGTTGAPQ